MGAQVARMATKTVVVNGVYNTTFGSGSEYYATVDEQASGITIAALLSMLKTH